MEQLFFLFSILLICSVIMTITSSNPIHSIFWMVLTFIYSSGFLISIKFEFLALIIIIIYIGAIAILFLFVIMMLDIVQLKKITSIYNIIPILFIVGINVLLESWWLFKYDQVWEFPTKSIKSPNLEILAHVNSLAENLYTDYVLPFFIVSLLLLVAMIGTIVLTLELSFITKKQNLSTQHHRNNSWI